MTTPDVLKRFLNRLPEFYKQEGTYDEEGFTEIGQLFYNDIDESGAFVSSGLEINAKGRHLEVDLLITGHTNYKLAALSVQEQLTINSEITKVSESNKVDYADGLSLDRLGKIFDISRGDWSDDELRRFIKSTVTGLIGGGTSLNLRAALSITIGIPVENIRLEDISAAHFKVTVPYEYITAKPELNTVINKYKPAGVSFELITGFKCVWDNGKWDDCVWA